MEMFFYTIFSTDEHFLSETLDMFSLRTNFSSVSMVSFFSVASVGQGTIEDAQHGENKKSCVGRVV